MSDQKKERPILFSGDMVRAILAGRKTMTRRAVKPQPIAGEGVRTCPHCASDWAYTVNGGACSCSGVTNRYGNPGDRLWVKETFGFSHQADDINQKERVVYYRAGEPYHVTDSGIDSLKHCQSGCLMEPNHYVRKPDVWKPSIFMPRWASRITLEIVSTRIERLNDISEEDVKREGIKTSIGSGMIEGETCYHFTTNSGYMRGHRGAVLAFKDLWCSINGPESWDANPFVWVIEFKRLEGGAK